MAETKHIRMKIGDAEFEADVPADSVQGMYEQFLTAIGSRPAAALPPAQVEIPNKEPIVPAIPSVISSNGMDDVMAARLFELRQDGTVALRALPKGEQREADAYLLLLYGYRRLKNEERILGTQLLQSARYSGIPDWRPADALSAHDQYVIRGGIKKGSTYQLNNPGVTKAEEIAVKIFA